MCLCVCVTETERLLHDWKISIFTQTEEERLSGTFSVNECVKVHCRMEEITVD